MRESSFLVWLITSHRGATGASGFYQYRFYLNRLRAYCGENQLRVWAYCLMPNHVHLVAVPEFPDSLGKSMRALNTCFALYLNEAQGWSGHLWQNRFYSCPLSDEHLWAAVKYVEQNPVRAGLVGRAEDYLWSSARAHVSRRVDPVLSDDCPLLDEVTDWRTWLAGEMLQGNIDLIRRKTKTGRPLGDVQFVAAIQDRLGRDLQPGKRGRPSLTVRPPQEK